MVVKEYHSTCLKAGLIKFFLTKDFLKLSGAESSISWQQSTVN